MRKSLSKKTKKVIDENLEEFMMMPPLMELIRMHYRDVVSNCDLVRTSPFCLFYLTRYTRRVHSQVWIYLGSRKAEHLSSVTFWAEEVVVD